MFVSEGCFLKSINVFPSTPPGLGCLCFLLLGFCTFPTLGEASKIHTESPFSERGLVSPPLLPRGAGDACSGVSGSELRRDEPPAPRFDIVYAPCKSFVVLFVGFLLHLKHFSGSKSGRKNCLVSLTWLSCFLL